MSDEREFAWGERVEKFSGDYGGAGTIVGILNWDGKRRYAVAFRVEDGFGRFVHILSGHQLRALPSQDGRAKS